MSVVLSAKDVADIKKAIGQCEDAKIMCQKGAACGFDYSGQEALAIATQERLKQVLNEFAAKGISPS